MMNNLSSSIRNVYTLIAIQARSTSQRLPGKILEHIGSKSILSMVQQACDSSKRHVERQKPDKTRIKHVIDIAILHPYHDELLMKSFKTMGCQLVAGPEDDVLQRYLNAVERFNPDYIVRLTADCPMLLPFMISKHINTAVYNSLDYVSNVHESCRTVADGLDVEIMSRRAIEWLKTNATTAREKEHVTLAIREKMPKELSMGFVFSNLDTSGMKLSVDTLDDLEFVRSMYHERERKMAEAVKIFGFKGIYEC